MKITTADVTHIANLANLNLSEADKERYAKDLEEILAYVEQLNELDTSHVQPMAQVLHESDAAPLREDLPGNSFEASEALRSAPLSGADHFKVPRVIDR